MMYFQVTQAHLVPPIILFLAKHPVVSKFDLSSITKLISGAAPLGDGLTEEVMHRMNAPVVQGQ
jgi:non-ribosomal peptide synthetase component E (peptide arylation enzyme)